MSNVDPTRVQQSRRQYCFGNFTLDLDRGLLKERDGEDVLLRPKPFEVLAYLVEHRGCVVTKTALIDAVWPDSAVTDNSLAQCLVEIRKALGDESQQLIRTVPRRGYIFAGPITAPPAEFPRIAPLPETEPAHSQPAPPPLPALKGTRTTGLIAILLGLGVLIAAVWLVLPKPHPALTQNPTYTQITNFTDSVVSPAVSPDGRMIAFIRSASWFYTPDEIYVKQLPDGEPVQLTHDPRPKYGLAFSPDGARLAYTVAGSKGWTTVIVSIVGGASNDLLTNAAGLTWLNERQLLFSEIKKGLHMGVVTATETRADHREIYFPDDERGMAHLSYASPDRKWALVAEMNPVWQPCRLIALNSSSRWRQVGPNGNCTSAAWSPDGNWMYFGVAVGGSHHLWRQRFPNGEPEQITSGLTEEDGVAVEPDGRSLVTSIGIRDSAVWIHDSHGDRPLTSHGYAPAGWNERGWFANIPTFSSDGKSMFFLESESPQAGAELWRMEIESGKSEKVVPGTSMIEYSISPDSKDVVFSNQPAGKPAQIWIASLDRSYAPRLILSSGEESPRFGNDGWIFFRLTEGQNHFVGRIKTDGSGRAKVTSYPIGNIEFISPDGRWISTIAAENGGGGNVLPLDGGPPHQICGGCPINWSHDGKFIYVGIQPDSLTTPGKTLAIPLASGEMVPNVPRTGIRTADASAFPGAKIVDGYQVSPGPDPSTFAYVKTSMHRNLFRIPIR